MSTIEADAKPSAEVAGVSSSPSAAAPASGGGSPHKLPLIITGTEEHGPFVPHHDRIHDVKPALKKHPHFGVDADDMMADDAGADGDDEGGAGEDVDADDAMEENGGSKKKKAKKALKWDEHAIEEHDLLRGTRMKVSRDQLAMNDSFVPFALAIRGIL